MKQLPLRVQERFDELQKNNPKNLDVKVIKNYFFVYESTSRWDKEKRKVISVTKYLGRIKEDGEFKPANSRLKISSSAEDKIHELEEQIKSMKLLLETKQESSANNISKNTYERTILMALSMNGRISYSLLGKLLGIKETATAAQIKKLEKKYEIKYTPEIDVEKLGYLQFLIRVKFLKGVPRLNELKDVLSKEPRVQLALLIKGKFDLIIYALAKNSIEMSNTILNIRANLGYEGYWNASPIYVAYNFIPVRTQFIELLKDNLLSREYAVLRELNENGNIDFTEIDKKYGFDNGRAQYSFHKLEQSGILKRLTISMDKLPIKYIGAITEAIINEAKFKQNREISIKDIIGETQNQINKYLYVADTFSPDGSISFIPVFHYDDLDREMDRLSKLDRGIRLRSLVITNLILGNFCYRLFDNAYSIQQDILEREYKLPKKERINYGQKETKKSNSTESLL